MPHDVFLSHSHTDRNVANAICAHLEGRGIRCSLAPRDVKPGAVWAAEVLGAIKSSRALVLVWSRESNVSDQVLRELERAVNAGVTIVPFRIHEGPPSDAVEYLLAATHWLDALSPPLERHIERLGDTLAALLQHAPLPRVPEPVPSARRLPWRRVVLPLALVGAGVGLAAMLGWIGPGATEEPSPAPPAPPGVRGSGDGPAPAPAPTPATAVAAPWLEQRIERGNAFGLVVHGKVTLVGRQGKATLLRAAFERPDGTALKDLDGIHATGTGEVAVERKVVPGEATATFDDVNLFLPYVDLHVIEDQPPGERTNPLAYRLVVLAEESGETLATSGPQAFEVKTTQSAEGRAQFRRVWVTEEGTESEKSVVVHADMRVRWRTEKPTHVQAFFGFRDGLPLKDKDGAFATPKGFVTTGETVTPRFEDAVWEDLVLRIPVEQLHLAPGMLHDLDVVLQVTVPATGEVLGESAHALFRAGSR